METKKPKLKIKINSDISHKLEDIKQERKLNNTRRIVSKKDKEKVQETDEVSVPLWFTKMQAFTTKFNKDYKVDLGVCEEALKKGDEVGVIGNFINRRKIF